MVAVAGVSYDLSTTGRIGARFAPRAYRETSQYYASAFAQDEMVEIITGDRMRRARRLRLLDLGDLTVYPTRVGADRGRASGGHREDRRAWGAADHPGRRSARNRPLVQGFAAAVRERTGRGAGYIQFRASSTSARSIRRGAPCGGDRGASHPRLGRCRATQHGLDWHQRLPPAGGLEFAKKNGAGRLPARGGAARRHRRGQERAVETCRGGCAAIW